jgi:molybdate transport system substrate-binding protein
MVEGAPWSARARRASLAVAIAAVAACGGGGDEGSSGSGDASGGGSGASGEITVYAAESLTDPFTAIGPSFESVYENVTTKFNFDVSQTLVQGIEDGAAVDVFASADQANMDDFVAAGLNGAEPVTFATSEMTIVVPIDNPNDVADVADLANPDLDVVLCAEESPCGSYAKQVLDAAGVTVTPSNTVTNTSEIVAAVEQGDADAGIIYATDVSAAGDATTVPIREDVNVEVEYLIAPVAGSANEQVAQDFVEYVMGPEGQQLLEQYDFTVP